jgi:hypothetical protein
LDGGLWARGASVYGSACEAPAPAIAAGLSAAAADVSELLAVRAGGLWAEWLSSSAEVPRPMNQLLTILTLPYRFAWFLARPWVNLFLIVGDMRWGKR